MSVPLRRRFSFSIWCKDGFCLRIIFAFVFVTVQLNDVYVSDPDLRVSGVNFGWVPLGIREGDIMPHKSWVRYKPA